MIIRKLFKFENAHIVRNCTTKRCSQNVHGHSYKVEVLLESNFLDNGQMVYDFGLVKLKMKELIDSFDHTITLWSGDNQAYIADMKKHSLRWIELPVSPSAEQFSRVIFLLMEKVLQNSTFNNGEREVYINSVIVHETDTGYAQAFKEDADSELMGIIALKDIIFSPQIQAEWSNNSLYNELINQ